MIHPRRFLLLAAAPVFFGAAAALAAPAAPPLTFPEDQRVSTNKTPSFDWGDVAASTYTLQIATSADFTTVTISSTGMQSSSYTVTAGQALTRGATYYWRVRSSDATGDGPFSSTFSFHVSLNRLTYVIDLDTSTPFSTPITVSQQVVSPDFISPTTNQYTLTPGQSLAGGTTYYWRVKATDSAGNASAYSTPDSKIVIGVFPNPVLAAPADQKRLITTAPLLSWASVAGASSYTVTVSTLPDFSLVWFSSAGIIGTQYQVRPADNLLDVTTFYWSVAATDNVSLSVSSRSFYVELVSTSTLIFPEDGRLTTDKTPSFQWSVPAGTSAIRDLTFTLEWATNPGMASPQAQTAVSTDNYTLVAGLGQTLSRGSTYYWRVKTIDNVGTTLISSTRSFNVSWNRVGYTLDVDTSTPFSTPITVSQQVIAGDFIAPTTNQYTLTPGQSLAGGATYYWRVRAADSAGNVSAYSSPDSKIVIGTFPSPVLSSPADQKRLITTAPLLTWAAVGGASSYTVTVSTLPDFSLVWFSSAGIIGTQYQVRPADGLLDVTTFYWSVAATDNVSTSVSSRTFYIELASTSTLVFPEDGRLTTDKTPSFQWSVPAGTSAIRDLTFTLQIAANPGMTAPSNQTGISTDNFTLGAALTRGTTYWWRVETLDNAGTALVSSTQTLYVSANRVAYTLDVDTSTPFSTPITVTQQIVAGDYVSATPNAYTLTPGQSLTGGTTYYWRVKAADSAGNVSAYSTPDSKIVIGTFPDPVLNLPSDQVRLITTTPLFSWGSVTGASSYTVTVSTLPDFSLVWFSSAGIIGTQYQVRPADNLLDVTTFYWSVAATDNVSTSVSSRAFYVELVSTAAVIFPDDGRLTSDKTPSFQWSVPGGTSNIRDLTFTLEWTPDPTFAATSAMTSISTDNYTLNAGIGQGLTRGTTYYWRVRTVDNVGTTLISSTRTFTVSSNTVVYTLEVDDVTPLTAPMYVSDTMTVTQYGLRPWEALANGVPAYFWHVKATDAAGNVSASGDHSFTLLPACPAAKAVCAQGCYYGTIQSAVNSIPSAVAPYSCVVITDGATYPEQVTVRNFDTSGSSIAILSDPYSGLRPVVAPPVGSTAAFQLANASVSIQGIDIVPSNVMNWGVLASSAQIVVSSVAVNDGAGRIKTAGIQLSSGGAASFCSVTVLAAHGFSLSGATGTTVSNSTAQVNSSSFYAFNLTAASSDSVVASVGSNPSGIGALIGTGSTLNSISGSTVTGTPGATGALVIDGTTNSVTGSYVYNAGGVGAYIDGSSNTVGSSFIGSGAASPALQITGVSSTTVTGSVLSSPLGYGLFMNLDGYTTISLSTAAGGGVGKVGIAVNNSSWTTISGAYAQGSSAVNVNGSTATTIAGSVLIATNTAGTALDVFNGSVGLDAYSSVLQGGSLGQGLYLETGNSGSLNLTTSTIGGAQYGISILGQAPGTTIAITSNTILPILQFNPTNTYGIYLNGLTTGATIYNNGIYYRAASPGNDFNDTTYGLVAAGVTGLSFHHNRFNNPGVIPSGGSLVVASFSSAQQTGFEHNDVNYSCGSLNNATEIQVIASTVVLRNNAFNFLCAASTRLDLSASAASGIRADYNDWFATAGAFALNWGSTYVTMAAWQTTGQDAHSLSADPLYFNPAVGIEDFHPLSVHGRCATVLPYQATSPPSCSVYSIDGSHSPTIDAGSPADDFSLEPIPSGRRVNMGSYGNTAEASESRRKLQVIVIQ